MGKYTAPPPSWQDVCTALLHVKHPHLRWQLTVTAYDDTRVLVDVALIYTPQPWIHKVVARDGGYASSRKPGSVESTALVAALRLNSRLSGHTGADLARWAHWELETGKTL